MSTSRLRDAALMATAVSQIVVDTRGRLASCNQRAAELLAISPEDVGRSVQELAVSSRPVELSAALDVALRNGRSGRVRGVDLVGAASERVVLDVDVVPLSDDAGTLLGVLVVFDDVSQRHLLQDELLHARQQLGSAYAELRNTNDELVITNRELQSTGRELESLNHELRSTRRAQLARQDALDRLNRLLTSVLGRPGRGVVVVDSAMRVLVWNQFAQELSGLGSADTIGALLEDLGTGLPVERLREPVRALASGSSVAPMLIHDAAVDRSGHAVPVRVVLSAILDHAGRSSAVLIELEPEGDAVA